MKFITPIILALTLWLTGCSVNPVTGEKQLLLVSPEQELSIGEQQYQPSIQSQGGEYLQDPELTAYVADIGQRLASLSDRPELPYEFVIINDSTPNAWALPGGKIAVNRGLLVALNNEAELAAVLGHEIVHAAASHGAQKLSQANIMNSGLALLNVGLANNDYRDLVLQGSQVGLQLMSSRYGRGQELEADRYGMEYMHKAGYDSTAAVSLQETFLALSGGDQGGWQALFASHPPSSERITANQASSQLFPGGELGTQRYQKQMQRLTEQAPAYQEYDKGQQALAKKQWQQAASYAKRAQKSLPSEGIFYELEAIALQQQGQNQAALASLDKAVSHNPRFFRHYLLRGKLHQAIGNDNEAKSDLTQSQQLLPTTVASEALGQMFLADGQQQRGEHYLSLAASGQGDVAATARDTLLRLRIQRQPGDYLQAQVATDGNGNSVLLLSNLTPLTLANPELQLIHSSFGNVRITLPRVIPPRSSTRLSAGELRLSSAKLLETRIGVLGVDIK